MTKKLTTLAVFLTMFVLTSNYTNSAYANTYMVAASKAVDHVIGFHKDANDAEESRVVIETEKEPTKTLKTKAEQTKIQRTENVDVKRTIVVTATAYSSTSDQTDNTPCIAATGYNVCNKTEDVIAVSRDLVRSLGYGKLVRFPEIFGSKKFRIVDTMNIRFVGRIDFHLDSREEAKIFGVKRLVVMEVI
ncbi:MAG: hypothetical protein Q7S43_03620 [bacterium]|nr:hypothetical protein [bacterium]